MKTISDIKKEIEKILIFCKFKKCEDYYIKGKVRIYLYNKSGMIIYVNLKDGSVLESTNEFIDKRQKFKDEDFENEVYNIIELFNSNIKEEEPFSNFFRDYKLKNLIASIL